MQERIWIDNIYLLPNPFYLCFKFGIDILTCTTRLVLDFFDESEPPLEVVLVAAKTSTLDRLHNLNESIHKDREEGHSENLYYASKYFLCHRYWIIVSVSHSG